MSQNDLAPVERLYARLTESLQRTRRDPFDIPITVAEIYQELVPYRLVRTEIGFDMNADYEHALLRLLAGEGEHVRIEPAQAKEEMRRELRSANPNLSLYREYAACDAWVSKPATAADATPFEIFTLAEDQPAEEREDEHAHTPPPTSTPMTDARSTKPVASAPAVSADRSPAAEPERSPAAEPDRSPVTAPERPPVAAPERPPVATPASAQQPSRTEVPRCAFCDSALPQERSARFCPYCGADQTNRPCASCGEVVEPGWVYCVACGTPAQ